MERKFWYILGVVLVLVIISYNVVGVKSLISPETPAPSPFPNQFYWVNGDTGNDNNDGLSEENPFETIPKAVAVAPPGSTIYVMSRVNGAVYTLCDFKLNKTLNLIGQDPDTTIVTCTEYLKSNILYIDEDSSGTKISNFKFRSDFQNQIWIYGANSVTLEHNVIECLAYNINHNSAIVFAPSVQDFHLNENVIYNCPMGLFIMSSNCDNCLIDHNQFYGPPVQNGQAIVLDTDYLRVRGLFIDNTFVRWVTLLRAGDHGNRLSDDSDVTFQRNVIRGYAPTMPHVQYIDNII